MDDASIYVSIFAAFILIVFIGVLITPKKCPPCPELKCPKCPHCPDCVCPKIPSPTLKCVCDGKNSGDGNGEYEDDETPSPSSDCGSLTDQTSCNNEATCEWRKSGFIGNRGTCIEVNEECAGKTKKNDCNATTGCKWERKIGLNNGVCVTE